MDISIVIVSYNSSNLLMLTIAPVRRAIEGLKAEVFVVDNDSKDGCPRARRARDTMGQTHQDGREQRFLGRQQ